MINDLYQTASAEAQLNSIACTMISKRNSFCKCFLKHLSTTHWFPSYFVAYFVPFVHHHMCLDQEICFKYGKTLNSYQIAGQAIYFATFYFEWHIKSNKVVESHLRGIVACISGLTFSTRWGMQDLYQPFVQCPGTSHST